MSHAPIDVTVLGRQRMRLHPEGNACETRILVLPHIYDRFELRLLAHVLQPNSVFIDIGANVGIYSIYAALRAGPGARIIAIEPHPIAIERLRCNVLLNNLTTVTIEPIALNDHSGTVVLRSPRNIGNSSIIQGVGADMLIDVPGESLMDLIGRHELTKIDVIKIDVEGAEDLVLHPFFANAPEELWPTLLFVENSANLWQKNCSAMLMQKGYRQRMSPTRNMVFSR